VLEKQVDHILQQVVIIPLGRRNIRYLLVLLLLVLLF
jgi:hypothetical protein